jgi:hypothetical protein
MQAIENNRWVPRDDSPEITELAIGVIKQCIKDDIKDGIDPLALLYDERVVGGLWWEIIEKSAQIDISDIKQMILNEAWQLRKYDLVKVS